MLLDVNDEKLTQEYDDFIAQSDYGNFFQSRQWSEVKNNWGRHFFYLKQQGKICAAMSVLSVSDSLTNKMFFYAPRGPVCNLYNLELVKTLIAEVKTYALKHDAFLLRIDPEVEDDENIIAQYAQENLHFLKNPALSSQPLMSLILDIKGRSAEEILSDFDKKARYDIRFSYRQGIEPYAGTQADLETFYNFIAEISANKSIGHRSPEYFKRVCDAYSETCRLQFAGYNDELIAGAMTIGFSNTLTYLYGADPIRVKKNQSAQIQFENIKHAVKAGYDYYDLGGIFSTDISDGLYQFKRKFAENNIIRWIGNLDIVLDQKVYDKYYTYHMERFDWSKSDVAREDIENK
ncbi:MAG: aminoacyltransferase [Fastidiosipila sp.]|nr:aminoacyltransferase [Fastidiosipila sp.]